MTAVSVIDAISEDGGPTSSPDELLAALTLLLVLTQH